MWNFLLALFAFPTACMMVTGGLSGDIVVMVVTWIGAAIFVIAVYPWKKKKK